MRKKLTEKPTSIIIISIEYIDRLYTYLSLSLFIGRFPLNYQFVSLTLIMILYNYSFPSYPSIRIRS